MLECEVKKCIYLIIKNDLNVSKQQIALDLTADWANDW